jgi:hypothetical protein
LLAAGLAAAGEVAALPASGAGAAGAAGGQASGASAGMPVGQAPDNGAVTDGWRREGRARGIDRWPG